MRYAATDSTLESVAAGRSEAGHLTSMRRSTRSVLPFAIAAAVLAAGPAHAGAQIFRGTVRSVKSSVPVPLATVTLRDSSGTVLGMATTDSAGLWGIRLRRHTGPVEVRVRRLGFEMGTITVAQKPETDTLDYEFLLDEIAATAEAVRVTAAASLNEKRLNEAYRRGWKVYEPELVAQVRERSQDLTQLIRALGNTSMYPPRGPNDCFRATRNNQCLAIVVDGVVMTGNPIVLPSDVYFLAVLGASEARIQFGDRAPYGAIAVYTRSRLDRYGGERRP